MIPVPSSRSTIPDAPYPSMIECMAKPKPINRERTREQCGKDVLIRSILTDQPMTTQQVHRQAVLLGIELTIDQLRGKLRSFANRGRGVIEVKIPGYPAEWVKG